MNVGNSAVSPENGALIMLVTSKVDAKLLLYIVMKGRFPAPCAPLTGNRAALVAGENGEAFVGCGNEAAPAAGGSEAAPATGGNGAIPADGACAGRTNACPGGAVPMLCPLKGPWAARTGPPGAKNPPDTEPPNCIFCRIWAIGSVALFCLLPSEATRCVLTCVLVVLVESAVESVAGALRWLTAIVCA